MCPDAPAALVAQLRDALAPGSYVVISHGTTDGQPPHVAEAMEHYAQTTAEFQPRSHAEILRFFDGLELIDPGLVPVARWRPDGLRDAGHEGRIAASPGPRGSAQAAYRRGREPSMQLTAAREPAVTYLPGREPPHARHARKQVRALLEAWDLREHADLGELIASWPRTRCATATGQSGYGCPSPAVTCGLRCTTTAVAALSAGTLAVTMNAAGAWNCSTG